MDYFYKYNVDWYEEEVLIVKINDSNSALAEAYFIEKNLGWGLFD